MKTFRFLVSLITRENDYQHDMALVAEETAHRLGVDVQIAYAENDADAQSRVILDAICLPANQRPDGIIVMPVGNGRVEVADTAAKSGIGWAVLNRYVDYLAELRRTYPVPVFSVSVDQEEVGRIQGRQLAALMPKGGAAVCLMGPSGSLAASYRFVGLQATKPANINLRTLRGDWTEQSGYQAVKNWLNVSQQNASSVLAVAAQSDDMAVGASRAFAECAPAVKDQVAFLGIDGASAAQDWIHSRLLTASVGVPVTAGVAIETMLSALQTGRKPERNMTVSPAAIPELEALGRGTAAAV